MAAAWCCLSAVIGMAIVGETAIANGSGNGNESGDTSEVNIDGGWYTPLYKENGEATRAWVASFEMDRYQVTDREYWLFVQNNSKWHPNSISPLFADDNYLSHLLEDPARRELNRPVVNVSWYAAMAYCQASGKTLPSGDQWEYAARASDTAIDATDLPAFRQKILQWYSKPASEELPLVHETSANVWGVHGMHGVVWEHTSDFNNILTTGESRADTALDKRLFCGSGAARAVDPGDYAAFMRHALRGSYKSHYTLSSMGFRCVRQQSN